MTSFNDAHPHYSQFSFQIKLNLIRTLFNEENKKKTHTQTFQTTKVLHLIR